MTGGITQKGQFLTLVPSQLRLYLPTLERGASCLGFGAPPSELGRQIGTVGLLIELIAGVSYCTRAANWQPGHLPENLRSRQKINKKGNWGETDLGSQFFIFVKLV